MIREKPSEAQYVLLQPYTSEKDERLMAWDLIQAFRLVLRPAIVGTGWFCGRFRSVDLTGQKICVVDATVAYASTVELAVFYAALLCIETGWINLV